jgi:hypothetical protein
MGDRLIVSSYIAQQFQYQYNTWLRGPNYRGKPYFSYAGNIVTSLRSRLYSEKVENLIIVKLNDQLLRELGRLK